jgi:hypothetical protein
VRKKAEALRSASRSSFARAKRIFKWKIGGRCQRLQYHKRHATLPVFDSILVIALNIPNTVSLSRTAKREDDALTENVIGGA